MECQVCEKEDWEYVHTYPVGDVKVCSDCVARVKHVWLNQRVMASNLANLIALARLVP